MKIDKGGGTRKVFNFIFLSYSNYLRKLRYKCVADADLVYLFCFLVNILVYNFI